MDLFMSWSGNLSKQIAKELSDWIVLMFDDVEPWMSPKIPKGRSWAMELLKQLDKSNFGIICLTPDNLNEAWLLFEGGALAKKLYSSSADKDESTITGVVPFLYHVSVKELPEPFRALQCTKFEKEDVEHLMRTIETALGKKPMSDRKFDRKFKMLWKDLHKRLNSGKYVDQIEIKTVKKIRRENEEKAKLRRRSYELYALDFGIGHDKVKFSCNIRENGAATFRRWIIAEATSSISQLDTFLHFPNESEKSGEFEGLRVESRVDDIDVDVISSMESVRADSLHQTLGFTPSLKDGDIVAYELIETAENRVFALGRNIKLKKKTGRPKKSKEEFFGWSVYRPTRRLELEVNFPKNEKPRKPRTEVRRVASKGFAKDNIETAAQSSLREPQLIKSKNSYVLTWEVDFPLMGLVYMLVWHPYYEKKRKKKSKKK